MSQLEAEIKGRNTGWSWQGLDELEEDAGGAGWEPAVGDEGVQGQSGEVESREPAELDDFNVGIIEEIGLLVHLMYAVQGYCTTVGKRHQIA